MQNSQSDFVMKIGHNEHATFAIDLNLQDLLVSGTMVGDTTDERCYIPVFRASDTAQDTWYLGSIVM